MTRPLDKHLDGDELDSLVSLQGISVPGSVQLPESSRREARRHVESCRECSQELQRHQFVYDEMSRMRVPHPPPSTRECIGDAEWPEVAAGLLPEAKTRELMKHAAQCGHCGPLLKDAAELLVDEMTPSEETWLASLPSTQIEWRRNFAKTLRAGAGSKAKDNDTNDDRRRKTLTSSWRWLLPWPRPALLLLPIAVAVVAGWLGSRILQPPSADRLLAQAYTERRTLEVRIPGAKYAPMRVERSLGGSNLDKPAVLLKAEALIGEGLQKNPNDPALLDARARADMLDGNYDSAVKTLQRVLETQPDSSPLLTDLGSAYYLRAESADRAVDYGNAVEALGRALAKTPDDTIALFNRALACEQMFLYTQAVDDWEHYLRVDPQGEWAGEARKRLKAIQEKVKQRAERLAEPLLTPAVIAKVVVDHAKDLSVIDEQAERYLEAAWKSWLPGAIEGSTDAQASLRYLAEILRNNHNDPWLADFLQGSPSRSRDAAVRELLASDEALHTGQYEQGARLAAQSARNFERSRNQAGMLRANFAVIRARASELDYAGCLETAASNLPLLAQSQYRWLNAGVLIQQGNCLSGAAKLQESIKSNSRALELTKRSHYPELELRAKAFASRYLLDTDNSDLGLRQLLNALAVFWQSDTPDKNGELLYALLPDFADHSHWSRVEAFAWAELSNRFPSKNPMDRALEQEFLAGAQSRAGDYQAAQMTLLRASAQITSLPDDTGTLLRRAEIILDKAEIDLDLSDTNGAVSSLAPLRKQFEGAGLGQFQANYFKVLGEAYLALGQPTEAQPLLERALAVMETGVRSLHQETDKLAWSRSQGEVYRDLLDLRLKTETPEEALAWWEWYKGASLRISEMSESAGPDTENVHRLSGLRTSPVTSDAGMAIVSYAMLRNSIAAFVFYEGSTHSYSLELPRDLVSLARHFLAMSSDPSTDLDSLNAQGWQLYNLLVAPLEADIQGATTLSIETDGILDEIPFTLLHGRDGRYLGEKFAVIFSQGSAYSPWRSAGLPDALSPASPVLIVVPPAAQNASLPALPDAVTEANEVAAFFNHPRLISGSDVTSPEVLASLHGAQIFHFAGHAVAATNRAGLVLGPDVTLTSHDLLTLRPHNLKLAVLSACESANGSDGTVADINSVARTMAAAGVRSVVASRWKVDSSATRQLMRAFYSNLMSGKTPADSLRTASLAVRSVPQYRHPYYWASFAIFGSP